MKEYKEKRDYVKAGLATFLLSIFLVVCVILDYQDVRSYVLLWACFGQDFLAIYWPQNPSLFLLRISLPFSTPFDTMVPLMPLIIVIVYLDKIGRYLKLNLFYFRGRRIHHYHLGVLTSLVGIIWASLKTGAATILLNGKETSPTEITQGLGLCFLIGGMIFIILDYNDLRNRRPKSA